jgi:hypothetical protein
MTVRELLEANFSKTEIDGFKKTYEETKTRQSYASLLRRDIFAIKLATLKMLANHFTNGSIEKLLSSSNKVLKSKKKYPKSPIFSLFP